MANNAEVNFDNTWVLIIIDMQKGFDQTYWGRRNNPALEANVQDLLRRWRASNLHVIHVRHDSTEPQSPLRPGQSGNEFKDGIAPLGNELLITKNVNSAFIGTSLEKYLRDNNLANLVLCGLTSDHCVSTTARMAANLGFNVILPEACLATFDRTAFDGKHWTAEDIHSSALASLNGEFARVVDQRKVIAWVLNVTV